MIPRVVDEAHQAFLDYSDTRPITSARALSEYIRVSEQNLPEVERRGIYPAIVDQKADTEVVPAFTINDHDQAHYCRACSPLTTGERNTLLLATGLFALGLLLGVTYLFLSSLPAIAAGLRYLVHG